MPCSWAKGNISGAVNKHDSSIFTGMDWNGLVWDNLIQKIRLIEQKVLRDDLSGECRKGDLLPFLN